MVTIIEFYIKKDKVQTELPKIYYKLNLTKNNKKQLVIDSTQNNSNYNNNNNNNNNKK